MRRVETSLLRRKPIEAYIFDIAYRQRIRTILNWLQPKSGNVILDCGSGMGIVSALIAQQSEAEIVSLDMNPRRLIWAKQMTRSMAHTICASATHLPFRDRAFDEIVLAEILEHVDEDYKTLLEARRVLGTDGVMVVTVPNSAYPVLWDPLNRMLTRFGHEPIREGPMAGIWGGHKRLYSTGSIELTLIDAGFKVQKIEGLVHFCLPFHHQLLPFLWSAPPVMARFLVAAFDRLNIRCDSWDKQAELKCVNLAVLAVK